MELTQSVKSDVTADEARSRPNDPGHPSVRMLAHGTMEARWYRPQGETKHHPHDRDEVYVVIAGSACFHRGNDTAPFGEEHVALLGEQAVTVSAGHVIFVPAGTEHRFDEISDDFEAWTVFYGPEGGERP